MNRTIWFDLGMGALMAGLILPPFVPWELIPWRAVGYFIFVAFLGFMGGLFLGCLLAMASRADQKNQENP